MHPKSNSKVKYYFKGFYQKKFGSEKLINDAFITIYLSSTLISNSIFLKKNICLLKSKLLKTYHSYRVNVIHNRFKCNFVNLDEWKDKFDLNKSILNKNKYLNILNKDIHLRQSLKGIDKILLEIKKL